MHFLVFTSLKISKLYYFLRSNTLTTDCIYFGHNFHLEKPNCIALQELLDM